MPAASRCPVHLIKGEQIRFKKLDMHLYKWKMLHLIM